MTRPADVFWHMFETTGSVWAYLAYRAYLPAASRAAFSAVLGGWIASLSLN